MHFRSEREVVRLRRVEYLGSSKWWCVRFKHFILVNLSGFRIPTPFNDFSNGDHSISSISNSHLTHADRLLSADTQFITHEIPFHIITELPNLHCNDQWVHHVYLSSPLYRPCFVLPELLLLPYPSASSLRRTSSMIFDLYTPQFDGRRIQQHFA